MEVAPAETRLAVASLIVWLGSVTASSMATMSIDTAASDTLSSSGRHVHGEPGRGDQPDMYAQRCGDGPAHVTDACGWRVMSPILA